MLKDIDSNNLYIVLFFCSSEHHALNYYTTEQLVVLRKELGTYFQQQDNSCLKQV